MSKPEGMAEVEMRQETPKRSNDDSEQPNNDEGEWIVKVGSRDIGEYKGDNGSLNIVRFIGVQMELPRNPT
ncbi:hypothetical protein V6N11_017599 [Hibiscus sabdariffa]|uniref:Uncharacterized protein n=1 Tax=Hibiscus sabdariffa TaxID=183260 RepID=A0ABR2TYV6_9ROSI